MVLSAAASISEPRLKTPRRCEVIADALLKRGYPERVAEKVLGRNFVEALGRIWT